MGFSSLRSIPAFVLVFGVLALCPRASAVTAAEHTRRGHDHYFNLEYDEAIASYSKALELNPADPHTYNHLATAVLFKELNRLGMLETSAFKEDNEFLDREKPQPDPQVAETFRKHLFDGRERAEQVLKETPRDRMAWFAMAQNYALHANYQFMIEKSYVAALRNGQRARGYSNKLRKHYPEFIDGYLVAGVQEYVVGSLPWAVRALIAIGGIRGSKEKGEDWVEMVADKGTLIRTEARVLLSLLYRRERRPLEAAKLLEGLIAEFPRNYVLRLELAAMYEDAQEFDRALEIFRETQEMVRNDTHRFARTPERLRKALGRKIDELQKKKQAANANRAGFHDPTSTRRRAVASTLPANAAGQPKAWDSAKSFHSFLRRAIMGVCLRFRPDLSVRLNCGRDCQGSHQARARRRSCQA
jgi:tetratricopeptide (TPR) repeat protein